MAKSSARSTVKSSKNSPRKAPSKSTKGNTQGDGQAELLARIAGALERLAPPPPAVPDFAAAEAFVWHPEGRKLAAVRRVNRVDMSLLQGIERVRDLLVENTELHDAP